MEIQFEFFLLITVIMMIMYKIIFIMVSYNIKAYIFININAHLLDDFCNYV